MAMRVGIYARVSTSDRDQNPETQLLPLREFCAAQGWQVTGEYVDHASATDLRGRRAWRRLLDVAAKRHVDLILVWKLDRAFRSVLDAATTTDQLRRWGCGLRSYSEPWLDTSGQSPAANLMFTIMTGFAEFERSLIAERVRAGMARAQKQGRHVGRPGGTHRLGFETRWQALAPDVAAGRVSQREAARRLGVGKSTVSRLVSQRPVREGTDNAA
jgi:DNA invertase Pin-like site-specific DNA recombinase